MSRERAGAQVTSASVRGRRCVSRISVCARPGTSPHTPAPTMPGWNASPAGIATGPPKSVSPSSRTKSSPSRTVSSSEWVERKSETDATEPAAIRSGPSFGSQRRTVAWPVSVISTRIQSSSAAKGR